MAIGIFGAGSVGCHVGGMLALAGEMPVLVGRQAMAERLAGGIDISDHAGTRRVAAPGSYRFSTDPAALGECDCVLVAVKSGATREAGELLARTLRPGAVVASLQNGVSNASVLRETLPGMTVLACMVGYNVAQIGERRFHRGTEGEIAIEDGPGSLDLATRLLRAEIPAMVHRDIVSIQWGKLLLNLNNAVNTLSGLPLKTQLLDRRWRLVLAASIEEALGAMRRAGIRPARVGKAPPGLLPHILRLPDFLFARIAASLLAVDEEARSSMAEDLDRGRQPEIDELNGEIVRLAASRGGRAPVNEAIVELVRQLFAANPPVHPKAETVLRAIGR